LSARNAPLTGCPAAPSTSRTFLALHCCASVPPGAGDIRHRTAFAHTPIHMERYKMQCGPEQPNGCMFGIALSFLISNPKDITRKGCAFREPLSYPICAWATEFAQCALASPRPLAQRCQSSLLAIVGYCCSNAARAASASWPAVWLSRLALLSYRPVAGCRP